MNGSGRPHGSGTQTITRAVAAVSDRVFLLASAQHATSLPAFLPPQRSSLVRAP